MTDRVDIEFASAEEVTFHDRRIRCVVAPIPTVSGVEQGRRRVASGATAILEDAFADGEPAALRGQPRRRVVVVSGVPPVPAAYRSPDTIAFYLQEVARPSCNDDVAPSSAPAAEASEPGVRPPRGSSMPCCATTVADMVPPAYEAALEPKRLVTIEGAHFALNTENFDIAGKAAVDWVVERLPPHP